MRRRSMLAAFVLAACRQESSEPLSTEMPERHAPRTVAEPAGLPSPGGCATLIASEDPDVVRVTEDGLVLYANEQIGLVVADVSEPDAPRIVGRSSFTGKPIGVFVHASYALVVYEPWDREGETVVRAVSLHGPERGATLAEITVPGVPRDARTVGDLLVVTRRTTEVVVSAFSFRAGVLEEDDVFHLEGSHSLTAGTPWGIAVAHHSSDQTRLTWIVASSKLTRGATVQLPSVASLEAIDVDEDAHVRLVGCSTDACTTSSYTAVDFGNPRAPRTLGKTTLPTSDRVAFLSDGFMTVHRTGETSLLTRYRGEADPVALGSTRVRGSVGSLAVRENTIFAVGWTGSASEGKRAVLHQVDVRRAPRRVGSIGFGGDWTWSPAYDDPHALSFDPRAMFAALPMTTVRGGSGPLASVQVFALDKGGARGGVRAWSESTEEADRLLFVEGRLLALSAAGISTIPLTRARE